MSRAGPGAGPARLCGLNLIYDPQVARIKGSGAVDRTSALTLSGALVVRLSQAVFVGPELRYLRAYDGAALNRFDGPALCLGPVLHYQVSEKGILTPADATRVFGHRRDPDFADRAFNPTQLARHTLRVRFGVEL